MPQGSPRPGATTNRQKRWKFDVMGTGTGSGLLTDSVERRRGQKCQRWFENDVFAMGKENFFAAICHVNYLPSKESNRGMCAAAFNNVAC